MATRTFEDKPATREQVPLLLGLMGPSGGGKTYSALRLATGIQSVTGGDIWMIDTEARRGLHYADRFNYRHVPFAPPHGSLDYLAAIEHCTKKGAKIVIIDSMSHEHEGVGGLLEQHETECQRLMGAWKSSREKVQMTAWAAPKSARRRMINSMLQIECSFILCFRAKEKMQIITGRNPESKGFMPIAGEELVFEMMVNALLLPGAKGVPTWQSDEIGERQMIKLPEQFRELLLKRQGPLDESVGSALAKWAAGDSEGPYARIAHAISLAANDSELDAAVAQLQAARATKTLKGNEYKTLVEAGKTKRAELEAALAGPAPDVEDDSEYEDDERSALEEGTEP